ncbi:hypothetical protein G6F42_021898 [Rhizopus arrhizus]|nr:hypothetical protein G6F42_021898 [Rhizopus arrhizus]
MPLPKILAPLLPQSQRLQQKQHDSVLSPALPMSPPSNNPYNNMIGLSTEETLVGSVEESAAETAIILHEKPTSFDMSDNDLLIESCHDDSEQLEQKETACMPVADTAVMASSITNTTYQSFGPSSSSLAMSLTDSGNETLIEITPDEEIEQPVRMPTPPLDRTTPVTPPQLMEEEHAFTDTIDQHQQDFVENPFQLTVTTFGQSQDIEEITGYTEEHIEVYQNPAAVDDIMAEQADEEQVRAQDDFTQPIQAVYTNHQGELWDEAQEPDFMMKSNFRRTPGREGSLKSKCMKLIRGMKFRLSQERKQKKKENRMKAAFEASADQERHIDTNLARSCSTVTILDEERLTPIYRRNIAKSILYNLTKTEPTTPYKSPEIGSDAYDIKVLCDQSFFGRY